MGQTMNKLSVKQMICWGISVGIPLLIVLALKDSAVIDMNQTLFLAITLFYILLTACELLDNLLIAVLLPTTYLFFKLAPAATIYSSWSNNIVWLCVSGMAFANILTRIGLLKRFVLYCVMKLGSSYRNVVLSFAVIALVLSIVSPSGGYIILAAIVFTFCQSLHLEGTKTGTGLMLAASLICSTNLFIYTPSSTGLTASFVASVYEGFTWDYVSYALHALPFVVPWLAMFVLTPFLFKEDVAINADVIRAEYDKLGDMTAAEKKGLVIAILFVISILTTSLHNIGILYWFVLSVVICYLPGINIGEKEDLRKVNFGLVFFIASFMGIGSVATATKFTDVLSALAIESLGSTQYSLVVLCAVFGLFGFVFNFLMTPVAMNAAFTTPIAQISLALGFPIVPVIVAFKMGCVSALLPYEIAKYLVFYAYGLFNFKDFAKFYGIQFVLYFVWMLAFMVPYWKLIGVA